MTQFEILEALMKLSPAERLAIVEATLRHTREHFRTTEHLEDHIRMKQQLAAAATALREDYAKDKELTIWTVLDTEVVS